MSSANGSPNSDISPADHRAATPSQPFPSPSLPPSSPLPPPSLSSGGASLHRLGISPFAQRPPQRRADASNSSQDDARDSRDVLLQRLADLMERVGDSHLGDDAVSEMHRRVDEMEDVARTTSPRGEKKPHPHPRPNTVPVEPRPNIWGTPSAILRPSFSDPAPFETTPGLPMLRPPPLHRHSVSEPIDDISLQLPALVQMRPGTREKMEAARRAEEAVRIAREAEQLNQHLATLITRLRARQEESEVSWLCDSVSDIAWGLMCEQHIHALLIEKAEKAAQRIIVLEEQVQDL